MLREKYNPDDIFKKRVAKTEDKQVENTKIVEYKESIIKRFLNALLRFLHLK